MHSTLAEQSAVSLTNSNSLLLSYPTFSWQNVYFILVLRASFWLRKKLYSIHNKKSEWKCRVSRFYFLTNILFNKGEKKVWIMNLYRFVSVQCSIYQTSRIYYVGYFEHILRSIPIMFLYTYIHINVIININYLYIWLFIIIIFIINL